MNFNVGSVSAKTNDLVSMMTHIINSEGCGVCEKKGAEVFWLSPYSRCAHTKCFKMIEAAESTLLQTIDNLFKETSNFGEQNYAHEKAIKGVRSACGSDTILSYLEKNGLDALTNLFNTVGIEAAKQYALKHK